jgi:Ala-tRNA(Pro) deacylase
MSDDNSERAIDRTTRHLDGRGVAYDVVEHERAFGAALEAVAAGYEPDAAAKSVLLHDGERYRLVVMQASERLDLHKVCDLLGLSRAELRLASEDEIAADFPQFELGAIPPLGELLPATEIVDRRLLGHERILCNAGDHTHSILLDPNEVVRVSDAQVADVCRD